MAKKITNEETMKRLMGQTSSKSKRPDPDKHLTFAWDSNGGRLHRQVGGGRMAALVEVIAAQILASKSGFDGAAQILAEGGTVEFKAAK